MTAKILISGFLPTTTIDYPDNISAVIFCKGCAWKCRYCHNRHLLKSKNIEWSDIKVVLEKRKDLLDAVVFSGGEATEQKYLIDCMKEVKAMGFKVGLHTNGTNPKKLIDILKYVDWVGIDIKSLKKDYPKTTGVEKSGDKAFESLDIILNSGVDYEVRTTVHSDLITAKQLEKLAKQLSEKGVKKYAIQMCLMDNCMDKDLKENSFDVRDFSHLFEGFTVRNAT